MTDVELIRALRACSCQVWTTPTKAADRMEALLEEVERLKAGKDKNVPTSTEGVE